MKKIAAFPAAVAGLCWPAPAFAQPDHDHGGRAARRCRPLRHSTRRRPSARRPPMRRRADAPGARRCAPSRCAAPIGIGACTITPAPAAHRDHDRDNGNRSGHRAARRRSDRPDPHHNKAACHHQRPGRPGDRPGPRPQLRNRPQLSPQFHAPSAASTPRPIAGPPAGMRIAGPLAKSCRALSGPRITGSTITTIMTCRRRRHGAVWVRDGDDALLIDRYSGEVIEVEYGIFY